MDKYQPLNPSSKTLDAEPLDEVAEIGVETSQIQTASARPSLFLRTWRLALVFVAMAHLFPIRIGILRLAMVAATVIVWLGTLFLFRKIRWVKPIWAVFTMLVMALLFGPGHGYSPAALRMEYVRSLERYDKVRYVWGGENSRGVDCSGLVRIGLIDADFNHGVRTLNPALIREGCSLWWYDCSAEALQNSYRSDSEALFTASNLNDIDYARIQPGDLAVTIGGQHVLAFIGSDTWIEADPNLDRVITIARPSKSIWFDQPMRIVRWRQLR